MEIGKILWNGTVEKEYHGQGFIYKNYENFKNKTGICYISEYGTDNIKEDDDYYTYEIMEKETEQAFNDYNVDREKHSVSDMIETVFDMVDWQSYTTLLYELIGGLEDQEEPKNETLNLL